MPNWSDNVTTVYFKDKYKKITMTDILRAYTFNEDEVRENPFEIHPFLVDKHLRHVPREQLAMLHNVIFGLRYEEIEKDSAKKEYYFAGVKSTGAGKNSLFQVETIHEEDWIYDQFQGTVSDTTKFPRDKVLALAREWFVKVIGCFDRRITCDWREYSINTIGTKWTFEVDEEYYDDHELVFSSQTAWGPPEQFMQTLANDFGLEVGACSEIEGEGWIHADDCLAEWDENDDCKYDFDRDHCHPDYVEDTYYPQGKGAA